MTQKRTPSADFALLRQQAEDHLRTTPEKNPALSKSPADMQRIIHELAVYQIELEMQQDELLQARAELEESLDCYTELYDFAPLGYLTLDRDGIIRKANLSASKLLGVNRSRLKGDRLVRFIATEELSVLNTLLARVFSTRDHASCEVMLQSDGDFSSSADPFGSGKIDHLRNRAVRIDAVVSNDGEEYRIVLSDISMQKQVELENKALLSKLMQNRKETSSSQSNDNARNYSHQLLDKIIHSRIRLAALCHLYTVDQASFVEIKKQIKTTDGNLSVHMRMLEVAEYISCDKEIQERKPQTIYRITQKGHDALINYKECLRSFLGT